MDVKFEDIPSRSTQSEIDERAKNRAIYHRRRGVYEGAPDEKNALMGMLTGTGVEPERDAERNQIVLRKTDYRTTSSPFLTLSAEHEPLPFVWGVHRVLSS